MRTVLLACAGAVTVSVVSAGSAVAAAGASPARAGHACQPSAYVSISHGRVRPVNLATRKVGKPIALPIPGIRRTVGAIAITPDGTTAYVYNYSNEGRWLTSINTATNKTGTPLPLRDFQYGLMVFAANGKNLYVAGRDVTLIHPPASKIVKEITFAHTGNVNNLILTAGGATLYAEGIGTLTPISTATNTPGTGIALPFDPFGVAVTPNGKTAYLTNWNKSTVVPLDLSTDVAGSPIKPIGLQPDQILVTPNGSTVYVESNDSGIVTPINTKTNTVGKAIKVAGAMALTPNGKTLFVLSADSVTPISTKTNRAGKPIKIGYPAGMVITPNSKTAWVISQTDNSIVPINVATGKAGKPIPVPGGPGTIALKNCPAP
jgi:DNA-binding beta-propeller fold protein YncE